MPIEVEYIQIEYNMADNYFNYLQNQGIFKEFCDKTAKWLNLRSYVWFVRLYGKNIHEL